MKVSMTEQCAFGSQIDEWGIGKKTGPRYNPLHEWILTYAAVAQETNEGMASF